MHSLPSLRLAHALTMLLGEQLEQAEAICKTLLLFGGGAVCFAAEAGIRITVLSQGTRYDDRSPNLQRLAVGIDDWPTPPAGIFVVEERCIYLRSCTPMAVAHEFGHALDCALGKGKYRSGFDEEIRSAFQNANAWITPYASIRVDEYFAESLRAYVDANDASSHWPKATRRRLMRIDPRIFKYIHHLFDNVFI